MKSGLLISSAIALVVLASCTKDAGTELSYTNTKGNNVYISLPYVKVSK